MRRRLAISLGNDADEPAAPEPPSQVKTPPSSALAALASYSDPDSDEGDDTNPHATTAPAAAAAAAAAGAGAGASIPLSQEQDPTAAVVDEASLTVPSSAPPSPNLPSTTHIHYAATQLDHLLMSTVATVSDGPPTATTVQLASHLSACVGGLRAVVRLWTEGNATSQGLWHRCVLAYRDILHASSLTKAAAAQTPSLSLAPTHVTGEPHPSLAAFRVVSPTEDLHYAMVSPPPAVYIDTTGTRHEDPSLSAGTLDGAAGGEVGAEHEDGWSAVYDKDSQSYYYAHIATGSVSWVAPSTPAPPVGDTGLLSCPDAQQLDLTSLLLCFDTTPDKPPSAGPLVGPFPETDLAPNDEAVIKHLAWALPGCGLLRIRLVRSNHWLLSFASHTITAYAYWLLTNGTAAVSGAVVGGWAPGSLKAAPSILQPARSMVVRYWGLKDPKTVLALPVHTIQHESLFHDNEKATVAEEAAVPAQSQSQSQPQPQPQPAVIVSAPVLASTDGGGMGGAGAGAGAGAEAGAGAGAGAGVSAGPSATATATPGSSPLPPPPPSATRTVVAAAAPKKSSKKRRKETPPIKPASKAASSLINKWRAVASAEDTSDETPEVKRQRQADEWRAEQLRSGQSQGNPNFTPVGPQ